MGDCQLIDAAGLAQLLKVSRRTIFRYGATGRIPSPVRIAGAMRWRLADIDFWVRWGCPLRRDFEARMANRL